MKKVIVIGGGAAGMMAAIMAAKSCQVILLEKNEKLGKKLFITGKGRCNLTNACDPDRFFNSVTTNRKFLYSSFYSFDNTMTMDFFEKLGLKIKVERGDRVFPQSDHSSDVIGVLKTQINRNPNITVRLNTKVISICEKNGTVNGVVIASGEIIAGDAVVLATGGVTYQLTGSTGDGFKFAGKMGHTVNKLLPSLVPFEIEEKFCKDIMGLALKNVSLNIYCGKKKIFEEQGELLFTHFGISGPLVIKASAYIHKYLDKDITMYIDLKPALDSEKLDDRILRDFEKYKNKEFKNALVELLPSKLIPAVIEQSGINQFKQTNAITKQERMELLHALKHFNLTFKGLRGFDEAIITKGGINVKEVNPSTLESKLINNLYFAGEILDVDALTGGFNLQIAWSTGYLAGLSLSEE